MSDANEELRNFVKVSENDASLRTPSEDIQGCIVSDINGEQMGRVEDLYADAEVGKVRFLDVSAGGLLGLGQKRFLVPVEAVSEVREDAVVVDQKRRKVAGSPPFDADVVLQPPNQDELYKYYGYLPPLH